MEKIDIVLWDEDVEQFIMNALSPAKTRQIQISSKDSKATVYVDTDNLSLAIGKNGQNVRLASKLTGWGIDIKSLEDLGEEAAAEAVEKKEMTISTAKKAPAKKKVSKKSKAKKDKIIDEE